jgi:hypothetical protein
VNKGQLNKLVIQPYKTNTASHSSSQQGINYTSFETVSDFIFDVLTVRELLWLQTAISTELEERTYTSLIRQYEHRKTFPQRLPNTEYKTATLRQNSKIKTSK